MQNLSLIKMGSQNVYKIQLRGFIHKSEMQQLYESAQKALVSPASNFRVFSDLRGFKPASPDVQAVMTQIQTLFKQKGLKKVAILVDNILTKIQLERLHKENRIKGTDMFFAAEEPNFMQNIESFLSV